MWNISFFNLGISTVVKRIILVRNKEKKDSVNELKVKLNKYM